MSTSWVSRISIASAIVSAIFNVGWVQGAPVEERTVTVLEVIAGVDVRRVPADWEECRAGMVLTEGHEVSCDPDGQVVLAFSDNSTVVVHPMTQIKIAAFAQKGGVVETEILLKFGELAAKVNKTETIRSDFKVRSPTATASVRGTSIRSIRFDLVGGTNIAMASGTLDMSGAKTSTTCRLTGTEAGSTSNDGTVIDARTKARRERATSAFAAGYSPDEKAAIQELWEPILGEPQASYESVPGLAGIAMEQVNTKEPPDDAPRDHGQFQQ